jgi:hypothetical protein
MKFELKIILVERIGQYHINYKAPNEIFYVPTSIFFFFFDNLGCSGLAFCKYVHLD